MKLPKSYNLVAIVGPTASGKTALAVKLARDLNAEIISADSRQVYQGMDIGTGKDLYEFHIDGQTIAHHMIDVVEPSSEFNVFQYQKMTFQTILDLWGKTLLPVLVGGSGLYIDAVINGYNLIKVPENEAYHLLYEKQELDLLISRLQELNPKLHNTTDLTDKKRLIRAIEIAEYMKKNPHLEASIPDINPLVVGIRWDRPLLRMRITERLKKRIENGLVEEVEGLHQSGISWEKLDYFGLEYRYVGLYLQGLLNKNDMFQKLNTSIHKFAKKQDTWFRRMEKKGTKIHWVEQGDYLKTKELVFNALKLPH